MLLRIASVLTGVHAVLHTANMFFSNPQPGAQQAAVTAMKANQFPLMGMTRSFWDFYMGFGLAVSIFLVVEAVVFWQLSNLINTDGRRFRPILGTFTVGYVAVAANSFTYFFAPPVITELLIAVFLGLAFMRAK